MIPIIGFLDKQDPLPKLGALVVPEAREEPKQVSQNVWMCSTRDDLNARLKMKGIRSLIASARDCKHGGYFA